MVQSKIKLARIRICSSVPINLFLRQREGLPAKASMLDFSAILENALAMRPDTNIVGCSVHIYLIL